VFTSPTRTLPWLSPVAIRTPSGENATAQAIPSRSASCGSERSTRPDSVSQSRRGMLQKPDVAVMAFPSRENAT
jgi:hypothetical protein